MKATDEKLHTALYISLNHGIVGRKETLNIRTTDKFY